MAGVLELANGRKLLRLTMGLLPCNAVGNGDKLAMTLVESNGSWIACRQGINGINMPWSQIIELTAEGDDSGSQYLAAVRTLGCDSRAVLVDICLNGVKEMWRPAMAGLAELPVKRLVMNDSLTITINPKGDGFHDVRASFRNVEERHVADMIGRKMVANQPNYFKNARLHRN